MKALMKGTSCLLSVLLLFSLIIVAFSSSVAHAETFSNVSEFPNFDMDCYVADLFTTDGNSLNVGIELELNSESTNKIMKNRIESDSLLMGTMTAWQIATFQASDTSHDAVTQIGYYESIILSALNSSIKSSAIKDVFDNAVIKNGKGLFSSYKSILKTEYALEFSDTTSFNTLSPEEQNSVLSSFENAFKKQYPKINDISKFLKIFGTIVKCAKSIEECMGLFTSYVHCSLVSDYLCQVVNDLYEQCPDSNITMKAALLNISSACTSTELDLGAISMDIIYRGFDITYGYVVDAWFDSVIAAHPVGLGLIIGQAIGKGISNFLFSTDEICENYYKMCCLDEFEQLLRSVTRYEMAKYKENRTNYNANCMFAAVGLMFNLNEINCDYAIDYAKTIYEKSVAGVFLSDEEYNNYVRTVNKIREYKQHDYSSLMTSYVYYLEEDYPEIYSSYMSLVEEIQNPVVRVDGLYFRKKNMEIGLSDDLWFFWNNAEVTPYNATNKTVKYYSSDESIVSVVPGNTLTIDAHKTGTVTITAISEDGDFSDQLTINIVDGHGTDGIYFEDPIPLEDYTYKIGETFSDTYNTYKIISKSTVGVVKGLANSNGVIIVPENVAYKNRLFTVTRIEDGKINGTGAFGGAFSNGNTYMNYKTYVSKVILPESLTYIGNYAFMYLSGLKEVRIPEGVTNLGVYLFDFSNVTTLYVPSTMLSLGLAGSSYSMASRYNSFKLKDVYYNGTKEMWDNVTEGTGDYVSIKSKRIHFVHSHSFSKKTIKEPSCTEYGVTEYTCICGETYTIQNTPKLEHSYGEWHVDSQATCQQEGSKHRLCSVCNFRDIENIPKTDHDYTVEIVSPSCTEEGYMLHTCLICGSFYKDTYVNAKGHTSGEWQIVKEPTEIEAGEKQLVCSVCGEVLEKETIPKLENRIVIGDVNVDGIITISDVTEIQKYLAEIIDFSDEQLALADTNGDGIINISDATHLQKYLAEFDGIVLGKQTA